MTDPLFILRRDDGKVMPGFKGRAGGTYVDPDDPTTHNGLPRLFRTAKAAGEALRWWVAGKVYMEGGSGRHDFGFDDEPDYGIGGQKPVEGRNANDWKVIPVLLTEII